MHLNGLVNINIKDKKKCSSKHKDYARLLDAIFFLLWQYQQNSMLARFELLVYRVYKGIPNLRKEL